MAIDPIPVLYFSNSGARGGVEEHILSLLHGLDRWQFQLHWACDPDLVPKVRADVPPHVELFPVRLVNPGHVSGALQLARILCARKIRILHSHMFQSSLVASPVGRLCRVPVVVETPHIREVWRKEKGWIKSHYFIDRMVGRTVTHYIAVSEANREYLVHAKGLPAGKMIVIRSASDISRWDPARPVPLALKRSLGFGDDDPVMLVAGRLEPQKGHAVLLQAMPAVLCQFPRARLVCVSGGSLREELERITRELGIQDAVRFVGYQPDLVEWYALADFTVLPSLFEGLPLAPIESLAAGRAVVATAVDGTPEVVLDGQTGLTVPPGDPARLAEAICRLIADPALRLQLARAGRAHVVERFGLQKLINETHDFHLRACREHGVKVPAAAAAATGS